MLEKDQHMYIAPGVADKEWLDLNLDDEDSVDWIKATEILRKRIYTRYLDAANLLIKDDEARKPLDRKYGFTVLAICCLLMETIQAFKDGLTDTNGKSKKTVKKFLMESPSFSQFFPDEDTAQSFYEHYRCGILHQAEVQEDSLVWSVGSLRGTVGTKQYVNRTEIFEKLKTDFDEYLERIKDKTNTELRRNFRTKMDFIARK
jgi:hypothetical protein